MFTTSRFRTYFSFSLYIPAIFACILLTCPQEARASSIEDLGASSDPFISGDGSAVFYGSGYAMYVDKDGTSSSLGLRVIDTSKDGSSILARKLGEAYCIFSGSNYSEYKTVTTDSGLSLSGMSRDATAVAGTSLSSGTTAVAYVSQDDWTSSTKVVLDSGFAYDISSLNDDGNWVAIGKDDSSTGTAWIINSTDYSVQAVTLSGFSSDIADITADGSMAVGTDYFIGPPIAATWNTSTGTLTTLPSDADNSYALAVNSDGSFIAGYVTYSGTDEAVYWYESGSSYTFKNLQDVLEEQGVDMTGWQLAEATGVSNNGTIFVGQTDAGDAYIARVTASSGSDDASGGSGDASGGSTSGVITVNQLNQSLSAMGQVGPAVSNMGQLSMSRLGSVAGGQGMSFSVNNPGASTGSSPSAGGETGLASGDEMPGRLDLWFVGSVGTNIEFNGDDLALHGGLGLSWETGEWRFGGGLFGDSRDLDTDYHGNQDIKAIGPGAFVAYSPEDTGLEFRVATIWQSVDLDLKRGYANGAGYATSKGSTSADVFGINGRAQWTTGVTETIALTPFAEYTWQSTHIDGYSESGGPFPASFDSRDEESNSMRLGLRSDFALFENVDTWAWAAWDHRFESKSSGLGGTTTGLGAFSYPGSRVDQDWADAGVGASWDITERLSTSTSLGFALGCDDDSVSDLTATVGLNYQLW